MVGMCSLRLLYGRLIQQLQARSLTLALVLVQALTLALTLALFLVLVLVLALQLTLREAGNRVIKRIQEQG